MLEADVERETLIQEELKLNDTLNNPKTSTVESNRASARLKEVYAQLEFIEADKAESRYEKKRGMNRGCSFFLLAY